MKTSFWLLDKHKPEESDTILVTLPGLPGSRLQGSGAVDAASKAIKRRRISNWEQKLLGLLLLLGTMLAV